MAFTYPPTGGSGTIETLNDIGDVAVDGAFGGAALVYDGTNWIATNEWSNQDANRVGDYAETAYFAPRVLTSNFMNDYWDPSNVTAIPFKFDRDLSLTNFAVFLQDFPAPTGNWQYGGKIHVSIYDDFGPGFTPVNKVIDLGTITIPATIGGSNQTFAATVPGGSTLLSRNIVYWVAIRMAFLDSSGNPTGASGVGPRYLQSIGTGVEPMAQIPMGLNNIGWARGNGGGLYIDNFNGVPFGTSPDTLGGAYPFVSWSAASVVKAQNSPLVFLGGLKD